jgi:hypothetical protein
MTVGATGVIAWWIAVAPADSKLPAWPIYLFGAVALFGLYCLLAPLLRWWPWLEADGSDRITALDSATSTGSLTPTAATTDARKATAAGQLSPPEALAHDLRWHLHKGQALEARVRGGSFGYVLTLLPEIETWTQQVHARLQKHPDLARRFLDAHPGFDSSNPASLFPDAQPIMSARVASLEEIIGELNGKRRQGARSGEPTSELREDSSSRQAWGKPDEKAG